VPKVLGESFATVIKDTPFYNDIISQRVHISSDDVVEQLIGKIIFSLLCNSDV
jgi:hypothetical protein